MSHFIVLVKQVPDVSKITDNAFDPETGNLQRARLPSVINELDDQALAFAELTRRSSDSPGKIIALTMGPPQAEEVLRHCLARGADEAVLLSDRVLGGADTVATANPLAFAIRRIARELLGGSEDWLVVAGMQSVDGDTAQVPAQIAEELGIPCVAYATGVEKVGQRLEFTRIISGGRQVVSPRRLPAVITVALYEYTLFPTVHGTRSARRAPIHRWTAADVQAKSVGSKGSKTWVIRVFPPQKTSRRCEQVESVAQLASAITSAHSDSSTGAETTQHRRYLLPTHRASAFDRSFEGNEKQGRGFGELERALLAQGLSSPQEITPELRERLHASLDASLGKASLDSMIDNLKRLEPSFKGDVWVVAEQQGRELHPATFELTGKARELADSLGVRVGVVLAGADLESYARPIIEAGADDIILLDDPRLSHFDPGLHRRAVASAIERHWPQIVLFAATPQGRVLAPMVSYRLHCGLTADCTALDILDNTRKGEVAILHQTRPALGGNVMATICTKDSRSQMATARPGVMKRLPADPGRVGTILREEVVLDESDHHLDIIRTDVATEQVSLDAEVIVTGGRGLGNRERWEQLVGELSNAIQKRLGVSVERGASRAAVEQGFTNRSRQIGQTGTSVGPRIYIALGVSGAIQHMVGVANSGTIIAINRDAQAPILNQCDLFMVGDVERVVPELVRALKGAAS